MKRMNKKPIRANQMSDEMTYVWDAIEEYGIATNEEIELVCTINGYSIQSLNDIIYARTGYRNIESVLDDFERTKGGQRL